MTNDLNIKQIVDKFFEREQDVLEEMIKEYELEPKTLIRGLEYFRTDNYDSFLKYMAIEIRKYYIQRFTVAIEYDKIEKIITNNVMYKCILKFCCV